MSRTSRIGSLAATIAIVGAVVFPAAGLASDGPVAHKSGAIVNYLTSGKVKLGKKLSVSFVCAVNCDLTSTLKLKGPGVHATNTQSTSVSAGGGVTHFFQINGQLRKFIKTDIGRFRLVSKVNATDPVTGATDAISRSFKLKR